LEHLSLDWNVEAWSTSWLNSVLGLVDSVLGLVDSVLGLVKILAQQCSGQAPLLIEKNAHTA
jgi:hypothetical protein